MSNLILRIVSADQSVKKMPLSRLMSIRAESNTEYMVVDSVSQQVVSGIEQRQLGSTLTLIHNGRPLVHINKFFAPGLNASVVTENLAAIPAVQQQPVAEPILVKPAPIIAPQPVAAEELIPEQSSQIVYNEAPSPKVVPQQVTPEPAVVYEDPEPTQRNANSAVIEVDTIETHDDSKWFDLSGLGGTGGLLIGGVGVLGLAALAASSGGGSDKNSGGGGSGGGVSGRVNGTAMLGPVIPNNDLKVEIYKPDLGSKIDQADVIVAEDGTFSFAIGSYTGVAYIKLFNDPASTSAIPDYLDEASNSSKDLINPLWAVIYIDQAGKTYDVNVTPLTHLAYLKLGSYLNYEFITGEDVNKVNDAIANMFGVEDVHKTKVTAVNDVAATPLFDGTTLSSDEVYGALLASISGMELKQNKSLDNILNALADEISFASSTDISTTYLSRSGEDALLDGMDQYHQAESAKTFSLPDSYAPTITSDSVAASIDQNIGANKSVYQIQAIDRSGVKFSLKNTDDRADFSVDETTGIVTLKSNPSYSTKSSYKFTVVTTDSYGNEASKEVTLSVNNPGSPDTTSPTFTSGESAEVNENISTSHVAYTAVATDTESSVSYSLLTTDDGGKLNINPATGAVTFRESPDYEAKTSYKFTVQAKDESNNSSQKTVTISIADLSEAAAGTATLSARPSVMKLEAGESQSLDLYPQMTTVGSDGQYVLVWQGYSLAEKAGIYVQRFNADHTQLGALIELNGSESIDDHAPQVVATGSDGSFVVAWHTTSNVYLQHFNADGSLNGDMKMIGSPNDSGIYAHDASDLSISHMQVQAKGDGYVLVWLEKSSQDDPVSVRVQTFDASGNVISNSIALDGDASSADKSYDYSPTVSVINTAGDFVVAWSGVDSAGDNSIFVQNFNSDGSTKGASVMLEPSNVTTTSDDKPAIIALSDGAYLVSWLGSDADGYWASYIQKFDSSGSKSGSILALDAETDKAGVNLAPKISAIGTGFVAAWSATDSDGDSSIYVQYYKADMSTNGALVKLEGAALSYGNDYAPEVIALGGGGEFVVTWYGHDELLDYSVFVQKFAADGTKLGEQIRLEPTGMLTGQDYLPQVIATGNTGAFVVSWYGQDIDGDMSIFTQPFDENGDPDFSATNANVQAYSNEEGVWVKGSDKGSIYLVSDEITVSGLNSITTAADSLWNELTIETANTDYGMSLFGLAGGSYHAYLVNADGALSQASEASISVRSDTEKPEVFLVGPAQQGYFYPDSTVIGSAAVVKSNGDYVTAFKAASSDKTYSVYVSKKSADGTMIGQGTKLDSTGIAQEKWDTVNDAPVIKLVGTDGSYVVSWYAADAGGDNTVFVQKFAADGSAVGATVSLEATDVSDGTDMSPNIVSFGTSGEYLVTWSGKDSGGDQSIFVQRFNIDGSKRNDVVQLEPSNTTSQNEWSPEAYALSDSSYAIAYVSQSTDNKMTAHVQKVTSLGQVVDSPVSIDLTAVPSNADEWGFRFAVLQDGNFAGMWVDNNSYGEKAVFVQRYTSGGAKRGEVIELDSAGVEPNALTTLDIHPVGGNGDFVVSWSSMMSTFGEYSTFTQKIAANGNLSGYTLEHSAVQAGMVQINTIDNSGAYSLSWSGSDAYGSKGVFLQMVNAEGQAVYQAPLANSQAATINVNEIGIVYLVRDDVNASNMSSIIQSDGAKWNSLEVYYPNTDLSLSLEGLQTGTYRAYAFDYAGNLSAASNSTIEVVETQSNVVVFDLVEGVSSDHSDRTFQAGVDYTVYIRVPSNSKDISLDGTSSADGLATWEQWKGADKLDSGDKIYLVSSGSKLEAAQGETANSYTVQADSAIWYNGASKAAILNKDGQIQRLYSGADKKVTIDLWAGNMASFSAVIQANVAESLDQQILITQGLA